jgi:hypothetical protein
MGGPLRENVYLGDAVVLDTNSIIELLVGVTTISIEIVFLGGVKDEEK